MDNWFGCVESAGDALVESAPLSTVAPATLLLEKPLLRVLARLIDESAPCRRNTIVHIWLPGRFPFFHPGAISIPSGGDIPTGRRLPESRATYGSGHDLPVR